MDEAQKEGVSTHMQVCGVRLPGAGSPVSIKKKVCKTTDLLTREDARRKETSKGTTDVRRHDNFRTSKPKPLADDVERLRSRKAKRDVSLITKNDNVDDIPDSNMELSHRPSSTALEASSGTLT